MDNTGVREIADMAKVEQPETFTPVLACRESIVIRNLEQYHEQRSRFRGTMTTPCIRDFCDYTTDQEEAAVFVDVNRMSAEAFFNLGTVEQPGHGDNTAILTLKDTAPYRAILAISGDLLSQRDAADWVTDWREYIIAVNDEGNEVPDIKLAISAIRNITIKDKSEAEHTEGHHRAARSGFESIEASSDHGIPAGLKFSCIPYDGLTKREFYLRLAVLARRNDAPVIKLTLTMQGENQEKMAAEFKDMLTDALSDTSIYLGDFTVGK